MPTLRLLLSLQRGWRSIGKMQGDEPTWIVSTISKPCLRYKEVFSVFEDQRYAGRCFALAKAVLQQGSPTPLVSVQHFDTDQRQVPMRLGWPVMLGHLEGTADIGLLFTSNAFCKDRLERAIIAANARRKPKRDTMTIAGALRRACLKRACSEAVPKASTSLAMAGSTSRAPAMISTEEVV
jgi:hypothetical protein